MTEIDNPFDGEASRVMRDKGVSAQVAKDAVVLRYLKEGNTEALAHWLLTDYRPGPTIAMFLSYMLQPIRLSNAEFAKLFEIDKEVVPYELVSKRRSGTKGRKTNSLAAEKNQAIYELYQHLNQKEGAGGSEAAVATLEAILDPGTSLSMIREAIKERSPKST